MVLEFGNFERVGPSKGSNSGGRFRDHRGEDWYLKYPNTERQGHNEIMASRFYDVMGFDAIQYEPVDNGMVASRWRYDLPDRSDLADLRESNEVQEAFLPSALLANWDVIGLVYDNCLIDASLKRPVFLDFGGSFDTRAMGGNKRFSATDVPALEGFTDASINQSATRVFEAMTPTKWKASKRRVRSLTPSEIEDVVSTVPLEGADARVQRLVERRDILVETGYDDVF